MVSHLAKSKGSHSTDFVHRTKRGDTCRPEILLWSKARETTALQAPGAEQHQGRSSRANAGGAETPWTLLLQTGAESRSQAAKGFCRTFERPGFKSWAWAAPEISQDGAKQPSPAVPAAASHSQHIPSSHPGSCSGPNESRMHPPAAPQGSVCLLLHFSDVNSLFSSPPMFNSP